MADGAAPSADALIGPSSFLDQRDRMPRWVPRAIFLAAFSVIMIGVVGWLFERISSILVMVLVSLFLSFALEPTVNRLHARGMKRGAATAVVFLGLLVFLIVFGVAVGKLLIDQVTQMIDKAPEYLTDLQGYVKRNLGWDVSVEQLQDQLTNADGPVRQFAQGLAGNALTVGVSALGGLFQGFTVLMFTFYLVADGPKVRRSICSRLSPARQQRVLTTWEIAIDKTGGYIASRALLGIFSAACASVVFTVLGIDSAIAIALLFAVVAQLIPVIGTYIGGLLAVLVALTARPSLAIYVIIYILVYQQIESYFIAPRVTSRTMSLHPAIALGSVIAGAGVLGVIGTVLALPAAAVIQALISTYTQEYEVIESTMTKDEAEEEAAAMYDSTNHPSRRQTDRVIDSGPAPPDT